MQSEEQRYTGTVRKWLDDRGYGFVRADNDPTQDIFVHHSAVRGGGRITLAFGQRVEFSVERDREGRPRAVDVLLEPAAT
jgi:CspA family cold shock protein